MGAFPGIGTTVEGVGSDHEGVLGIDERSQLVHVEKRYQPCASLEVRQGCSGGVPITALCARPVRVVGWDGHE